VVNQEVFFSDHSVGGARTFVTRVYTRALLESLGSQFLTRMID